MKNVLISIKSYQSTDQTTDPSDEESFEFVTDGEYSVQDGVAELSYQESELTSADFAGTKTSFIIEPDRVILNRAGGIAGEMIFREGQKHHFVYEMSYGSMTMGIETQRIVREMDENGGNLEIYYAIDVDNIVMSRNSFKINVR
jgi:uncharacterized beta-barrel protein YwiB (DUF1934 family)